jgi:hypothetical protein
LPFDHSFQTTHGGRYPAYWRGFVTPVTVKFTGATRTTSPSVFAGAIAQESGQHAGHLFRTMLSSISTNCMTPRILQTLLLTLVFASGCRPAGSVSREDDFRAFATQFMQSKVIESEPQQAPDGQWFRIRRIVRNCQFEFYPPGESNEPDRAVVRYEFKPLYTANHPSASDAELDPDFGSPGALAHDVGWRWQTAMFHWRNGAWVQLQ